MPYINDKARKHFDSIKEVPTANVAGELNYLFTRLAVKYFQEHPNYQGINDVLGALEGAKLEFYRRLAAPYEDVKIEENGDVYE